MKHSTKPNTFLLYENCKYMFSQHFLNHSFHIILNNNTKNLQLSKPNYLMTTNLRRIIFRQEARLQEGHSSYRNEAGVDVLQTYNPHIIANEAIFKQTSKLLLKLTTAHRSSVYLEFTCFAETENFFLKIL